MASSAPARIQKRHAGDPIATRARFVAGLPPRSGWLGSRPAIADTLGSPGPDAGASCSGRWTWPSRANSAGWKLQHSFFPCEATSFIEDRLAECQPVAKGHCGRRRGLKELAAACDSVYMNTFFSTTIERWRIERSISCERNAPDSPWAGVGRSWSGNLHLQVFLPRSESFNEDSFAERQRGLKPISASCDYTCMNTFFSTTIERWRIERFIPCERNASCFVVGRSSSPH
jgi:hypothetical protein